MCIRLFVSALLLVSVFFVSKSFGEMPPFPDFNHEDDSNWVEAEWDTWPATSEEAFDPSDFDSEPAISKPMLTPSKEPDMFPVFPDLIGFKRNAGMPGRFRIECSNFKNANPYKKIWLEIRWKDLVGGNADDWLVEASADSYNPPTKLIAWDLKGGRENSSYMKLTWYFVLQPNPVEEYIDISFSVPGHPDSTTWKVDHIRLRTHCTVPEPSIFQLLLAASGFMFTCSIVRRLRCWRQN
ncbi:MAG: hypothetical protein JW818_18965 [Pirellulales bacterium]|nr:hypothetical protein [Pirellulales bacterium]